MRVQGSFLLALVALLAACKNDTSDAARSEFAGTPPPAPSLLPASSPTPTPSPSAAPTLSPTEQLLQQLQSKTAQSLRDPLSAQFQNLRISGSGKALCGEVNAKNGFGGYAGFAEFVTNEKEVLIAPPGCGSRQLFERGSDGVAQCLEYAMAFGKEKCPE